MTHRRTDILPTPNYDDIKIIDNVSHSNITIRSWTHVVGVEDKTNFWVRTLTYKIWEESTDKVMHRVATLPQKTDIYSALSVRVCVNCAVHSVSMCLVWWNIFLEIKTGHLVFTNQFGSSIIYETSWKLGEKDLLMRRMCAFVTPINSYFFTCSPLQINFILYRFIDEGRAIANFQGDGPFMVQKSVHSPFKSKQDKCFDRNVPKL